MITGVILLLLGVILLLYVGHAWKTGAVRMGSSGFREYTPTRDDSPLVFYLGILMYAGFALWLLVYGFMIMTGHADPVPFA